MITDDDLHDCHAEHSKKRKRHKKIAVVAAVAALVSQYSTLKRTRTPSMFRKRWDSEYLLNLAQQESTFVREYRVTPKGFDILLELLYDYLKVDEEMARRSQSLSGSKVVSVASRLGMALIILAGGRPLEAMRTHGVSETTCRNNFHKVIKVINSCYALAIKYPLTTESLERVADGFVQRSTHRLFKYCTGLFDCFCILMLLSLSLNRGCRWDSDMHQSSKEKVRYKPKPESKEMVFWEQDARGVQRTSMRGFEL